MSVKNIAIIGAGWSGLQISKVLIDCGFNVSIFEELCDVGGTWNPSNAYYDLWLHTPMYRCQFYDYEDFLNRNPLKKLRASDVFEYCKNYSKFTSLYSCAKFNTKITKVSYNSKTNKCILSAFDKQNSINTDYTFDFVINTQFNIPRMPSFKGIENFKGNLYHSNDIKEYRFDEITKRKDKVVLLGGSKSGTDIAYTFAKRNYNISWVLRSMYWFMCFDKTCFNSNTGKKPSLFYRMLYLFGTLFMINEFFTKIILFIWMITGYIKCPGKLHLNFRKFHLGYLDDDQLSIIAHQTNQIYSEIECLLEKQILLKNGQTIDCDTLICATGCDIIADEIELYKDGERINYKDIKYLYQYSVISEIPILCFTGLANLTFGPVNGYYRAAWILKFIEKNLSSKELYDISVKQSISSELYPFNKGNAMFDSSGFLLLTVKRRVRIMLTDFCDLKEFFGYVYNVIVKFDTAPLKSVKKYIDSKIKPEDPNILNEKFK